MKKLFLSSLGFMIAISMGVGSVMAGSALPLDLSSVGMPKGTKVSQVSSLEPGQIALYFSDEQGNEKLEVLVEDNRLLWEDNNGNGVVDGGDSISFSYEVSN